MQLRKPHAVGVLNDERVDVRNVNPGFDNRRAHQNVRLAVHHAPHDFRQLLFAHAPVSHDDPRLFSKQFLNVRRRAVNALNAVVDIVDLSAALQLAPHGVGDYPPVMLHDVSLHGLASGGRLVNRTHVAQAGQRHIQRARYRRRGQRENVHLSA